MFADDDHRLSLLWAGRRQPFLDFQVALASLAGAYDLRDGRSSDRMSRVSISVDDWDGQPIVPARRFPVAAFDDVLFAVQQTAARRQAETRALGWTDLVNTERRAAARDRWQARGADMDMFRASLREGFATAARLHDLAQTGDLPDHT
jgi:hypothetical protein